MAHASILNLIQYLSNTIDSSLIVFFFYSIYLPQAVICSEWTYYVTSILNAGFRFVYKMMRREALAFIVDAQRAVETLLTHRVQLAAIADLNRSCEQLIFFPL